MIHNEIISSKNLPDEYHQTIISLISDMFDSLHELSGKDEYGDPRLFLNALLIVHAEFLAVLIYSMRGEIDANEYVKNEMDGFLKNFDNIYKEYLARGGS